MYRHMVALLAFPLCLHAHHQTEEDISFDPEQESEEPVSNLPISVEVTKKLVSISQPVTLNCGKPGIDLTDSNIAWFYKPCGLGASDRPCDLSRDVGGRKMCRGSEIDPCPPKLLVDKPQPGLYRCYKTGVKSGYTMTATLVNIYQLEIIERKLEPEFVELPEDVEAFAGSSALFICRIRSPLPLHVKWYKQVARTPTAIQYENKYYQGLNGTNTAKNADIYMSKLKFRSVSLSDNGIYACGAVNEAGIQYREARLMVTPVAMRIPPSAPPGPWKATLFGCAAGFLVVLMTSLCCVRLARSSCGCRKSRASPTRVQSLPRRPPHPREEFESYVPVITEKQKFPYSSLHLAPKSSPQSPVGEGRSVLTPSPILPGNSCKVVGEHTHCKYRMDGFTAQPGHFPIPCIPTPMFSPAIPKSTALL